MLGGNEPDARQVDGIAGNNRLVVADVTDEFLARRQGVDAEIAADLEVCRMGAPMTAIAGRGIDAPNKGRDVDLVRCLAGKAPGEVDGVAVYSHLDGAKRLPLPLPRYLDKSVGDGVGKLVGMSREHPLGRAEDGGHDDVLHVSSCRLIELRAWWPSGSAVVTWPI